MLTDTGFLIICHCPRLAVITSLFRALLRERERSMRERSQ